MQTVGALLDGHGLVTIVGPGGIGKSTLALATATGREQALTGHARFLDLAHCRDGKDVLPYVAGVLDAPAPRGSGPKGIAEHLRGRSALLILDNCEQVIDAVAELVGELVSRAPGIRLLATSREALRVPGERVMRLSGLDIAPLDDGIGAAEARDYPAIGLLIDRASGLDADFVLKDGDVPAAIALCRRLDGIPLAIELAAARLDTMGLAELAARLEQGFSLLDGGLRTAMPRHRTLEAMLDWSFSALAEPERAVIAALSVFRGAFSLDAALAVVIGPGQTTGTAARCTGDLVAKSLIAVRADPDGRRYRLLETTRQYMALRLAERPAAGAVRQRHAAVCLDLIAGARDDLTRLPRDVWVERYGALVGDVQDAIEWAFSPEGDWTLGTALVAAATPLGEQLVLPASYFGQLAMIIDRAAPDAAEDDPVMAKLVLPLLHARVHLDGDLGTGRAIVQRMAAERDARQPEVLAGAVGAALVTGDYPDAIRLAQDIIDMGSLRDDLALRTLGERCAAQASYYLGHFARASELAQRVLDSPFEYLPLSVNNHRITMRVILGNAAAMAGDMDRALDLAAQAVALGRRDNPLTLCLALVLGAVPVALWAGDARRARGWIEEATTEAGRCGAAFWQMSAQQLATAVPPAAAGAARAPDPGLAEKIGHTVFDMLPTFAPDLLTPAALRRVLDGTVGWNAAEIRRIDALGRRGERRDRSLDQLREAAGLARKQGARLWFQRIEGSLALPAEPSGRKIRSGPG